MLPITTYKTLKYEKILSHKNSSLNHFWLLLVDNSKSHREYITNLRKICRRFRMQPSFVRNVLADSEDYSVSKSVYTFVGSIEVDHLKRVFNV